MKLYYNADGTVSLTSISVVEHAILIDALQKYIREDEHSVDVRCLLDELQRPQNKNNER